MSGSSASLYLIEILHQTTTEPSRTDIIRWLYLIEILHQTTTRFVDYCRFSCCILSKFYIKPQQRAPPVEISASCILSKFYIKPQLYFRYAARAFVVSYRNSTSNHNFARSVITGSLLYLIEILHQTTTFPPMVDGSVRCILSKFYIKPQHLNWDSEIDVVVSYRNSTSNHNKRLLIRVWY